MSQNIEQLGTVQRQLAFYRSPDFQVFLEQNIVRRASDLRAKIEALNLYSLEGREEALVSMAVAKELEAISKNLISDLEQLEKRIQGNMQTERLDKNPFSVANRPIE